MKLTLAQARNLTLNNQFYRFAGHIGKQGVLDVIRKLGYVQIDTISVIERAHHHTLYNRVKDYHPDMLNDLLARDKTIWEYWAHAAGYVPLEDYPFYKIRMANFPNGAWEKKFWDLHKDLEGPILQRIKTEGPLSSKHFDDPLAKRENLGWGDWKPAKVMLELLLWKGDLIVTARDKFQRVYDLTERVIPDYKNIKLPSERARAEFMVKRTLQSHGIASSHDINNHIKLAGRPAVDQALQNLIKKDKIRKAEIDGLKDDYYVNSETELEYLKDARPVNHVRLLSPFDNAAILRQRLQKIFGFDYALECYVTPAKRKYGYWNCPILWKDEFVGFLDPKADRKTKILTVNSVFIKKNIWKLKAFQAAFELELANFSRFNGCPVFSINKINLT
jgi:uncharacterized protein